MESMNSVFIFLQLNSTEYGIILHCILKNIIKQRSVIGAYFLCHKVGTGFENLFEILLLECMIAFI